MTLLRVVENRGHSSSGQTACMFVVSRWLDLTTLRPQSHPFFRKPLYKAIFFNFSEFSFTFRAKGKEQSRNWGGVEAVKICQDREGVGQKVA